MKLLSRNNPFKAVLVAALCFASVAAFAAEYAPVASGVYKWADHPVKKGDLRESRMILEGSSAHLDYFRIHATTQFVGAKPNAAKANEDVEELIIVKEGMLKFTINDKSEVLAAGSVILLQPGDTHIIENVGDVPLTYYVLKHRSDKKFSLERGNAAGGSQMYDVTELPLKASKRGGGRKYFDRPTSMTERYEMHITQLHSKGASHDPHEHVETEIILVISGETAMMIDGQEYSGLPGDLYFMEAHLPHGVRNLSDTKACSYFAFKWR